MGNLFNPENRIFRILTKFTEAIILSLMWSFFSIPIVTVGASTTALYYAINKALFHDNGYVWYEFWNSFKSNFKQSTIAWLLTLFFYVLAFLDFFILHGLIPSAKYPNFDYILLVIMLVLVTFWACYVFPCVARFQNSTKIILKNAFIIAFCNLPWTILLGVLLVIAFALFFLYPPLLFIIPTAYMCCAKLILERVFRKYISPEDLAEEEERNRVHKN